MCKIRCNNNQFTIYLYYHLNGVNIPVVIKNTQIKDNCLNNYFYNGFFLAVGVFDFIYQQTHCKRIKPQINLISLHRYII